MTVTTINAAAVAAMEPAPWLWPRAAYVHVPFCAHHCCYCDFAVVAGRDNLINRYLDALERELATLGRPQPIDTLFLGGGTPTHLAPQDLHRLLDSLRRWLPLRPGYEFSVEANPATLTAEKVEVLADAGVNRVSLGAQSFAAGTLQFLERDHDATIVHEALECVRRRIDNVSLDLIFGVPGQSVEAWRNDLAAALLLGVGHLSTYGLTYEKGTRLWKDREHGRVRALDEETELAMYLTAMEVLTAAGFEHYEISSFARPGRRCRHNLVYWANHAYFGFGLGAARYIEGQRETNTRDLQAYLRKMEANESAVMQSEKLDDQERALETMSLNLRRAEGICREELLQQTGIGVDALAGEAIGQLCQQGLLADNGAAIRLTARGKCVADAVVSRLICR
jgi:oxygen-independent coproporphyrinogen III oxidase